MGAINYRNNKDFLSIGFDLKNYDSDLCDANYFCCDCYDAIFEELKRQYFYYYNVKITSGYYDGFYFDIYFNFVYLDNYKEKRQAQKELTQLKKLLLWAIKNCGCVNYSAGWVSSYESPENTMKLLKKCIREERKKINALHTDKQVANMTKPQRAAIGLYW